MEEPSRRWRHWDDDDVQRIRDFIGSLSTVSDALRDDEFTLESLEIELIREQERREYQDESRL